MIFSRNSTLLILLYCAYVYCDNLRQIVYVSSAGFPNDSVLRNILRQSEINNESQDITGILLHQEGNFAQFLEGPSEKIERLYAKIERDIRHRHVIKIVDREIEQRSFPGWAMRYRNLDVLTGSDEVFEPPFMDSFTKTLLTSLTNTMTRQYTVSVHD